MTTTYRAAFGNPHAHRPVLESLRVEKEVQKPDTSCDAAVAAALAEEEGTAPGHDDGPVSPSGVKVAMNPWESAGVPSHVKQPQHHRSYSDGSFPQRQPRPASPSQQARPPVSDAELARQLQAVELAAHADATGIPSLLFPALSSQPSSRELTLSRTLSRAPSVRVQPHTLSSLALPPPEPAVSADRQRLLGTLQLYDLVERQVAGDGNCQFRALSDQLYGTPEHHDAVRQEVVATLRRRADVYRGYVPDEYGKYCDNMARSGTWGDHVTLQAAADTYGMRIVVVASFADSPVIHIEPASPKSQRTLYLSFWAEVHYNSLYPKQEPPLAAAAAAAAAGPIGSGPGAAAQQHPQQHSQQQQKPGAPQASKPPKVLGSSRLGKLVHGAAGGGGGGKAR